MPPGSTIQMSVTSPEECLPARYFIPLADTSLLSVTPGGLVLAKRLGEGHVRAYGTDTTVQSTNVTFVAVSVPLDLTERHSAAWAH